MKELLTIEDMNIFGNGIVFTNTGPIFVKNGVTGDQVEIKKTMKKRGYWLAEITKLHQKGTKRISPTCPYTSLCGGCAFANVDFETELAVKEKYLKKLFPDISFGKTIASDELYYRNKATFHCKNGILGFYAKETHELIKIDTCKLCDPKINQVLALLQTQTLKDGTITIRVSKTTRECMIVSDIPIDITPLKSVVDSYYENGEKIVGKSYIKEIIKDKIYTIFPNSFFQVNTSAMIQLYDVIEKYAGKGDFLLDLYCGSGSIGIYISDHFSSIVGIEKVADALLGAKLNKKYNHLEKITFEEKDLEKDFKYSKSIDVLIVDPPRKGLSKRLIAKIMELKPQKMIYVSCNPSTLKRDMSLLKNYTCEEITPVLQFYRTEHIECVAKLKLRK